MLRVETIESRGTFTSRPDEVAMVIWVLSCRRMVPCTCVPSVQVITTKVLTSVSCDCAWVGMAVSSSKQSAGANRLSGVYVVFIFALQGNGMSVYEGLVEIHTQKGHFSVTI